MCRAEGGWVAWLELLCLLAGCVDRGCRPVQIKDVQEGLRLQGLGIAQRRRLSAVGAHVCWIFTTGGLHRARYCTGLSA
jgi:hypothetical protein